MEEGKERALLFTLLHSTEQCRQEEGVERVVEIEEAALAACGQVGLLVHMHPGQDQSIHEAS